MKILADLHIHSHYSLATSKQLTPPYLDYWAKIKGINVIATGDFTHPKWLDELKETLEPAEDGLFKLKKNLTIDNPIDAEVRFILSAEISNIYKKNGKVRKIHNVVLAPDFETVEKIQKALAFRNFNITSDGRPILGLDAKDLLELLLEINENIIFFPAHIWTPWFAVLGSKSGFDTIEECFEDLTKYIKIAETGLSSDLPLNYLCSFLDKFNFVSNSDAHSPEKIGRNANILNTELSYWHIKEALENQNSDKFWGTIDLYPQEGKYHYDGHRKCGIRWNPVETMKNNGICPVCGKPVTLGVAHRIAQLADRKDFKQRPFQKNFIYIIPLKEILAEILKTKPTSKIVDKNYFNLIYKIGSEFDILFNADLQTIRKNGGNLLAEAIDRLRNNKVYIEEGFDGQYGVIRLFTDEELKNLEKSKDIFSATIKTEFKAPPKRKLLNFDVEEFLRLKKLNPLAKNKTQNFENKTDDLNPQQKNIVEKNDKNLMVIAGPGTGKTRVLTYKIKFLIENKIAEPDKILAITFTNQAAEEMKHRINNLLKEKPDNKLNIKTFHKFALDFLKNSEKQFTLINDEDKVFILEKLNVPKNKINKVLNEISLAKNTLNLPDDEELKFIIKKYDDFLEKNQILDLDTIILKTIEIFEKNPNLIPQFDFVLIDEFQDINAAQYKLISLLKQPKTIFFAIGDPNQNIYSFRGSSAEFIDKFLSDFNAEKFTLTQSYRCPDTILKATSPLMHNFSLVGLNEGVKINIIEQLTDKSEAEFIARNIENMIGGLRFFSIDSKITDGHSETEDLSLSDFVVLTRTKEQFATIIKAFNDHSIPYQIIGDTPFFKQKPFSTIIEILNFKQNPDNHWLRQKISNYLPFLEHHKNENTKEFLNQLWEKFFSKDYPKTDFEKFMLLFEKFPTVQSFLDYTITSQTADDIIIEKEAVKIMTLHASKGLEFKTVFIAGCSDGLIPYTIYRKDVDLEQEKKLLFVGMTRAEKNLFLTYPKQIEFRKRKFKLNKSRFIENLEKEFIAEKKAKLKSKPKDNQLKLF